MSEPSGPYVGKITQKAVLFGPDGDVLITKVDDHWEPPGGKFEFGETLVGGLRRELREGLDIDATVGPPVEAAYGGWIDGETGNPLVSLVYRCETDDRVVSLNEEHNDYEWVSPRRPPNDWARRSPLGSLARSNGRPHSAVRNRSRPWQTRTRMLK
ncbi:NUDIX domain-containing protein [Haladaptatus halobius]|uniref:NUDIX domain-containing protein n=1 Tax=Haladaptatus halobius TaxID=2884875 RepID=UPI001D0A1F25|nr:NUDIX domain-containing protein [Haladaptatus halobius]